MATQKFLDNNGLLYLWNKIKGILPSKTSDLTNDSGYITSSDIPAQTPASTSTPAMNGTAAVGTENAWARGDHVHPSDTAKVDKVEGKGLRTNDYTDAEKEKLAGIAAGANNYTLPDASTTGKGGVQIGNNIDVNEGTISVKDSTTAQKGVVQLSSAINSTDTDKAATPSAVKQAYDLANGKQSPAASLAGYGIQDAYTKDEVDGLMSAVYRYKGTVSTYAELPSTGRKTGDVYNVETADSTHGIKAGDNVAWNGTAWDVLAGDIDLTAYMLKADMAALSNAEIDAICT